MILDSLILQTRLFLQEDMSIELNGDEIEKSSPDKLILKDYTSMIATGGTLNSMIVISYDNEILSKLVEIFMDGEEVDSEEIDEVRDSVSGEVINTIIGLALPTFPNRGKGITITPPITINDAGNISKHKNAEIISTKIKTKYGEIAISAIISLEK